MAVELDPTDIWAWWRLAKEDPTRIGTPPLIVHPSEPHCGYYRVLPKGGNWEAVGIYPAEEGSNQLYMERSGKTVPRDRFEDLWVWCCRQPVEFEDYQRAIDGGGWEDEAPKAQGTGAIPETAEPIDALTVEFDGELAVAREMLAEPIREKPQADRAAQVAVRLMSISNRATKLHDVEKAPILRKGREIDDKWRNLMEGAADIGRKLKKHQEAFLKELERIERERVLAAQREAERKRQEAAEALRKAEEEKRRAAEEAERIRRAAVRAAQEAAERAKAEQDAAARAKAEQEAEEVRRRAAERADELIEQAARQADTAEVAAGQAVAEMLAAERATTFVNPSAGRTRAKVSLTTVTLAVVDDWVELFKAVQDRPEVREFLQKIADSAARGRNPLPGTHIVTDRRAR